MYLERLDISGIRNLEQAQLTFGNRLNLFFGQNGSGKTSLLEAIYLLGRGRSFRTRHLSAVICNSSKACLSAGQLRNNNNEKINLGVTREINGSFQFKLNREAVNSASQLATNLPLLLINSDSFLLLEGGPGNRRRYLDWLVFHVEHSSQGLWKRLFNVLKQRNSLLRRGKIEASELEFWDEEFNQVSDKVNQLREALFERLHPIISQCMDDLGGVSGITFKYLPGWDTGGDLVAQLKSAREQELRYRRTTLGPQYADIQIDLNGSPGKERLSRGQSKILVSAMFLAQARLMVEETGVTPIALVDDLPAELDVEHRQLVMDHLLTIGGQVFVTGVDLKDICFDISRYGEKGVKVFHVEHGAILNQKVGMQ